MGKNTPHYKELYEAEKAKAENYKRIMETQFSWLSQLRDNSYKPTPEMKQEINAHFFLINEFLK